MMKTYAKCVEISHTNKLMKNDHKKVDFQTFKMKNCITVLINMSIKS